MRARPPKPYVTLKGDLDKRTFLQVHRRAEHPAFRIVKDKAYKVQHFPLEGNVSMEDWYFQTLEEATIKYEELIR